MSWNIKVWLCFPNTHPIKTRPCSVRTLSPFLKQVNTLPHTPRDAKATVSDMRWQGHGPAGEAPEAVILLGPSQPSAVLFSRVCAASPRSRYHEGGTKSWETSYSGRHLASVTGGTSKALWFSGTVGSLGPETLRGEGAGVLTHLLSPRGGRAVTRGFPCYLVTEHLCLPGPRCKGLWSSDAAYTSPGSPLLGS